MKGIDFPELDKFPLLGCMSLLLADVTKAENSLRKSSDKELEKWLETYECIKSLDIIPNAGHCPHDEMPEKVNPIIEKIIQEAI